MGATDPAPQDRQAAASRPPLQQSPAQQVWQFQQVWAASGAPLEQVLAEAGTEGRTAAPEDPDAADCWFLAEVHLPGDHPQELRALGLAGAGTIWWDGDQLAEFSGAFTPVRLPLPVGGGTHRLAIQCRALKAEKTPRRPRARWLSSLVSQRWLRWQRVPLVGRFPWPGTAPVLGPLYGVQIRPLAPALESLRPRVDASGNGLLAVTVSGASPEQPGLLRLLDPSGEQVAASRVEAPGSTELTVASPRLWYPLGHGPQPRIAPSSVAPRPPLYTLQLLDAQQNLLDSRTLGFRTLAWEGTPTEPVLAVNGQEVFAVGAVWQPPDPKTVASRREDLVPALDLLAEAGTVMLRVPGTHGYESEAFYQECSRRGILVWQDAPLASLDYPDEQAWTAGFRQETAAQAERLAGHPCVVVLCGGSEVLQQPEMFGLPSGTSVPALDVVEEEAERSGLLPVRSSPSGGIPAIRADVGFSHWFGVGAYRRPLSAARTDRVRFASEALAFGTWAEPRREETARAARAAGTYAEATEPIQDPTADWTFQEVTASYARRSFPHYGHAGEEHRRHLERAACAQAIGTTLGWWRWQESGCHGGLVLSSQDITDGPDWGLLDRGTAPKAGWYGLAQAARPVALVLSDEGLNGLHLDVFLPPLQDSAAQDGLALRLRCVDAGGALTEDVQVPLERARALAVTGSAGTGSFRVHVETLLGGFRDLDHVWGFGEQQRAALVVELVGPEVLVQTVRLLGRGPEQVHPPDSSVRIAARFRDPHTVVLRSSGPAAHVAVDLCPEEGGAAQHRTPFPLDGYFHLAPGIERVVRLSGPAAVQSTRIVVRTSTNEENHPC